MKRIEFFKELKSIAASRMPGLALIDIQKGQIDPQNDNTSILPALLFEFKEANYDSSVKGNQLGQMLISVCLYQALKTNPSSEELVAENEVLLNNIDTVFQIFSGISVDTFSPLKRVSELAENPHSQYLYLGNNAEGLAVLRSTQVLPKYVCTRINFSTDVQDYIEVDVRKVKINTINIEEQLQ